MPPDAAASALPDRRPPTQPVLLAAVLLLALAPRAALGFDFDDVTERAQALAKQSFQPPPQVPEWLRQITYDQWRDVRYRPERALWKEKRQPFQVQFFHPGLYYDRLVAINVVNATGVQPLPFSPNDFDYGRNDSASRLPQNHGFAGFRIHAPIKKKDYYDEVIVFLGATYFRAVGKNEAFGLSARGLAIDTAMPSGEEFPYFREFWLVKPAPNAKQMVIYALLD